MPICLPSFAGVTQPASGGGEYNILSGSFDGTDDYLTTNESNLATSGDCTISLWFNSASLPGNGAYDYMFSLTDSRAAGKDRAIGIRGTGSDAQIVANTYASGWNLPFTNTSISASTWYHVAVVFTSGSAQVYFNGADKGSKSVATNTIAYTQTVIGGMLYSPANSFNGKIDEVSVFHSALSSTNITAIYNSGVPADISTLSPKGWWRNGDGTGDTDSGGGAPANTDTVGTVANQGSVNTGSGEGNMTGTNGPTFSTDVPPTLFSNYSVSFDETDDFVSFGTINSLSSASAYSVSVWYKKLNANKEGMILGAGNGNHGFYIQHYYDNKIYIGFGSTFASVSAISDTNWHHIVYSYGSSSHKLYWDGNDMSLGGTPPSSTHSTLGDTFYLGKWNTYAPHFGGEIDEVSIFDSALTASNVTSIYNSGVPNDISALNPVNWWRMGDNDGGTGTTITDQGSGGNDGTLTNGPTFSSTVPS